MKDWHPLVKCVVIGSTFIIGGIGIYDLSGTGSLEPTSRLAATSSIAFREDSQQQTEIAPYPDLNDFAETVGRPLFAVARRPMSTMDWPTEPPSVEDELIVRYVGSISDGEGTTALVNYMGRLLGIGLGDEIEGWEVVHVEIRRVIFARGSEQREFELFSWWRGKP